jgi:hypothetical protein
MSNLHKPLSTFVVKASFPAMQAYPAISGWGVRRKDGNKYMWAFYLYETEEQAKRFADGIGLERMSIEVNVSCDRPYSLVNKDGKHMLKEDFKS